MFQLLLLLLLLLPLVLVLVLLLLLLLLLLLPLLLQTPPPLLLLLFELLVTLSDSTSGSNNPYCSPTQESWRGGIPGLYGCIGYCTLFDCKGPPNNNDRYSMGCIRVTCSLANISKSTIPQVDLAKIHIIHQATGESEKEKVVPLSNLGTLLGGSKRMLTTPNLLFQRHWLTSVPDFRCWGRRQTSMMAVAKDRLNWLLAILNVLWSRCLQIFTMWVPCSTASGIGGAAMVEGTYKNKGQLSEESCHNKSSSCCCGCGCGCGCGCCLLLLLLLWWWWWWWWWCRGDVEWCHWLLVVLVLVMLVVLVEVVAAGAGEWWCGGYRLHRSPMEGCDAVNL